MYRLPVFPRFIKTCVDLWILQTLIVLRRRSVAPESCYRSRLRAILRSSRAMSHSLKRSRDDVTGKRDLYTYPILNEKVVGPCEPRESSRGKWKKPDTCRARMGHARETVSVWRRIAERRRGDTRRRRPDVRDEIPEWRTNYRPASPSSWISRLIQSCRRTSFSEDQRSFETKSVARSLAVGKGR